MFPHEPKMEHTTHRLNLLPATLLFHWTQQQNTQEWFDRGQVVWFCACSACVFSFDIWEGPNWCRQVEPLYVETLERPCPGFGKAMSDAGCTCNEAAQFNTPSNRPARDSTKHENKGQMGVGKTICSCKYNGQTVCIIMHIIKHFWLYTIIICSHTCCILGVPIKASKQAQGSSFVDPSPSGQALTIDLQVQKV